LGCQFPELCSDAGVTAPIGTDERALSWALQTELPGIDWPLQTQKMGMARSWDMKPYAPETLLVLDLIEFCYRNSAKPIQRHFHSYYQHHHLAFDVQAGREEFRDRINTIFSRNGLAYELNQIGAIVRLAPPILHESLLHAVFQTGDHTLDQMLEEARRKFLSPDLSLRREAVERLWDAWERMKTLERPDNKKISIGILLDKAAREPELRKVLADEARELSEIGNSFHIRHTEVTQTRITENAHFDYLFHRLFSMLQLLLRKR